MAAGAKLLDDSGNVMLDDSGNVMLDDGAGNNCCCVEPCATTFPVPTRCDPTMAEVLKVTVATTHCTTCVAGTGKSGMVSADLINRTYYVGPVAQSAQSTSQIHYAGRFGLRGGFARRWNFNASCTGTPDRLATFINLALSVSNTPGSSGATVGADGNMFDTALFDPPCFGTFSEPSVITSCTNALNSFDGLSHGGTIDFEFCPDCDPVITCPAGASATGNAATLTRNGACASCDTIVANAPFSSGRNGAATEIVALVTDIVPLRPVGCYWRWNVFYNGFANSGRLYLWYDGAEWVMLMTKLVGSVQQPRWVAFGLTPDLSSGTPTGTFVLDSSHAHPVTAGLGDANCNTCTVTVTLS